MAHPELITLLWSGTMALLILFGGLAVAVPRYRRGESSLEGLIAFAFSLAFWGMYSMFSLGFVVRTETETVVKQMQSMTVLGLIGAAIALVLLLDGAFRAIRGNA